MRKFKPDYFSFTAEFQAPPLLGYNHNRCKGVFKKLKL